MVNGRNKVCCRFPVAILWITGSTFIMVELLDEADPIGHRISVTHIGATQPQILRRESLDPLVLAELLLDEAFRPACRGWTTYIARHKAANPTARVIGPSHSLSC